MITSQSTMYELFLKHAPTKSEARRVYNLVKNTDLRVWTIEDLLKLDGIGRKSIILIVQVACDLEGVK